MADLEVQFDQIEQEYLRYNEQLNRSGIGKDYWAALQQNTAEARSRVGAKITALRRQKLEMLGPALDDLSEIDELNDAVLYEMAE